MIAGMAARLVSPVTIGRRTELASAIDALDAASAGSATHLLITGEAGVGKTRLIGELTTAANARGIRVLRGSCANVGDEGLPYGPVVEILAQLARETEPGDLAALVGTSGPDLARLVPAPRSRRRRASASNTNGCRPDSWMRSPGCSVVSPKPSRC